MKVWEVRWDNFVEIENEVKLYKKKNIAQAVFDRWTEDHLKNYKWNQIELDEDCLWDGDKNIQITLTERELI